MAGIVAVAAGVGQWGKGSIRCADGPIMNHHCSMNAVEKTEWICGQARGAGFDLCGIAPIAMGATTQASEGSAVDGTVGELAHLPEWLARGYAGEMNYLRDARRGDPRLVLD